MAAQMLDHVNQSKGPTNAYKEMMEKRLKLKSRGWRPKPVNKELPKKVFLSLMIMSLIADSVLHWRSWLKKRALLGH